MRKHAHAFTLLELLAWLSIALSLTAVGIPAYLAISQEQHLRQASTNLFISIALARSEATKRNQPVVLRARNNNWSEGWEVFADLNNNTLQETGEPLISSQDTPRQITIKGNSPVARYIRFTPMGRAKMPGGAFQAGTLTLCHASAATATRKLILSASGRVRSERQAASSRC